MTYSGPARTAARRTRSAILAAFAVVGATLVGALSCQTQASSSSPAAPSSSAASPSSAAPPSSAASPSDTRRRSRPAALGEADGAVPDGATVFDDIPAVTKLDPGLLAALRKAATDAAEDDVKFVVNSGWRSAEYQKKLLREAVRKYGSEKEAARWVATPDRSPHVSGDAIDLGPSDATKWLSEHGA